MAINTDSLQSRLDNWLQLISPFYSSDVKNEQDLSECLVKSILSLSFKLLKRTQSWSTDLQIVPQLYLWAVFIRFIYFI